VTESIKQLAARLEREGKIEQDQQLPAEEVIAPEPETRSQRLARMREKTAAYEAQNLCRRFFPWRCL